MILGFDTATSATVVALWDSAAGTERELRDDPPPGARPAHATRLLPMIAELLEGADRGWGELDAIAVGTGPGTFTGLRIGVASARALSRASGVPLVGVSTLRSLAHGGAGEDRADLVLAAVDARRGELFAAGWRREELQDPAATPVLGPAALAPEKLADAVAQHGLRLLALGGGAIESREALERSGALIPEDGSELHRVTALNHCRLASQMPTSGPDEVRPAYLRLPDAEISRRAAF